MLLLNSDAAGFVTELPIHFPANPTAREKLAQEMGVPDEYFDDTHFFDHFPYMSCKANNASESASVLGVVRFVESDIE